MSITIFHRPGAGAAVVATTYNWGDCIALAYQRGVLTALSTPVSGLSINGSALELVEGARVTQTCDGHREKVSLVDQQGFEDRAATKGLGPADFVQLLGDASAWVEGGDDVTIVSATLVRVDAPQGAPPPQTAG